MSLNLIRIKFFHSLVVSNKRRELLKCGVNASILKKGSWRHQLCSSTKRCWVECWFNNKKTSSLLEAVWGVLSKISQGLHFFSTNCANYFQGLFDSKRVLYGGGVNSTLLPFLLLAQKPTYFTIVWSLIFIKLFKTFYVVWCKH